MQTYTSLHFIRANLQLYHLDVVTESRLWQPAELNHEELQVWSVQGRLLKPNNNCFIFVLQKAGFDNRLGSITKRDKCGVGAWQLNHDNNGFIIAW